MRTRSEPIRLTSRTFPPSLWDRILREAHPFTETGHYRYPDDAQGNHTKGFFAIEPVTRSSAFVDAIADDVRAWAVKSLRGVDVVFAPAQPAVRPLADAVARRLGIPAAYWEYLPSGRFGDRLVDGSVPPGSRTLALNGVSLQGRCVGLRLPQFIERLGATTIGAAVFARGSTDLVRQTEERLGPRFYSAVQVEVPIYPASDCPMCSSTHEGPDSWRAFAEAPR